MAKQTFTVGQVLSAAQMTSLQQTALGGGSATAKTASYTLVAADAGTTVIMNSASATTITVNTSLFTAGDTVFIQNIGAGICTITAGTATVNTASSLALAQYASGDLYFTAAAASIFNKADGVAAGGGKVLQVKYFDTTTETTNTTTTNATTTLTGTITPTLNTSKVLITINQNGTSKATGSGSSAMMLRLFKNATQLVTLGEVLGITSVTQQVNFGGVGWSYLDSPATTSLITYNTEFASFVASVGVTVQQNDSRSTMILMEIGA